MWQYYEQFLQVAVKVDDVMKQVPLKIQRYFEDAIKITRLSRAPLPMVSPDEAATLKKIPCGDPATKERGVVFTGNPEGKVGYFFSSDLNILYLTLSGNTYKFSNYLAEPRVILDGTKSFLVTVGIEDKDDLGLSQVYRIRIVDGLSNTMDPISSSTIGQGDVNGPPRRSGPSPRPRHTPVRSQSLKIPTGGSSGSNGPSFFGRRIPITPNSTRQSFPTGLSGLSRSIVSGGGKGATPPAPVLLAEVKNSDQPLHLKPHSMS